MSIEFTKPVLCDYGGDTSKEWYVYFSFTFNGVKYDRKLREGINRIKSRKQRTLEGTALADARHQWLKSGWNPVTDPKFKLRNAVIGEHAAALTVQTALQWALDKKKLATKSRQDYANQLEYIKSAATALGYTGLPITEFKRFNVKCLLEQLDKDKSLSNHGYNKYRDTIRALCGELLQWEVIEYNPAAKIIGRQEVESDKYQALTEDEKQRIAEYLLANHFRFFVYSLVIYHTGIRPKEVLALRISDLDLKGQMIKIVPDLDEENAKTKKVRRVPVNNELLFYLYQLELHKYPEDYYIFGSPFGPGGNRGSAPGAIMGAMRPDYFLPSQNRIKRDTVTKLWHEVVKKKLGIDKYLYSMKHTGGDDKILAGVDLDALRSMYGHGNKRMTEIYTKQIKNVYRNEIIEKSPSFTSGKVVKIA